MVGTHNSRALRPNRALSAANTDYTREEQAPSTVGERLRPLMVPSEQLSERIVGDRVRGDGYGEILEIGDGPAEEVADPNTGSDAAIEIQAPDKVPQPASQSYIEELPRVSEQNSGPEGTELPKINPSEVSEIPHYSYLDGRSERVDPSIASKSSSATQLEESEASHDSWSEESRGPYIAVAPFGGPRSRKRPRRPRPQSPIC
ncbi:hypothetical protein F4774DRAFT_376116 [Daldinia eschscholtzii]|nr:hypothetical protein F4774DRAFT_376116 [Daldinia eschscholtzii]